MLIFHLLWRFVTNAPLNLFAVVPTLSTCNDSEVGNVLNREFDQDQELKVVVSDLTYVRVDKKWHYICILVDLYNRKIIGYSAGPNKTAALVQCAFASVSYNLNQLKIFHTVRVMSLRINSLTKHWRFSGIERSLSEKGSPYDNAVAEAMFKTIKTEFLNGTNFPCQQALDLEIFDYWFNNIRIHGSLDYLTPDQ